MTYSSTGSTSGTTTTGASTAAATAAAAAHARRLMLGGLLIELPPDQFEELAAKLGTLVVTGTVGSFLLKRRLYLLPHHGMTFYCKVGTGDRLGASEAVEVQHIDKGPLNL